jgi:hypothetical protein
VVDHLSVSAVSKGQGFGSQSQGGNDGVQGKVAGLGDKPATPEGDGPSTTERNQIHFCALAGYRETRSG